MNKTSNYWQNKVAAWLQESPVKVFDIENRDQNAQAIRAVVMEGMVPPQNDALVKTAASIASGMTRGVLPADFDKIKKIKLNHPLVQKKSLEFDLPAVALDTLIGEIQDLLRSDLQGIEAADQEERARQVFNYLFFAFNRRLRYSRATETRKLGALWDIIPADTRLPDHPIWHHLGLTSAIYSSLEQNGADAIKENLSMVVFSITPVQDFIGKARKLRDYWTGSVILSYLAFVGIARVMQELGPDHVLYPSLHNQSLVDLWLCQEHGYLEGFLKEENDGLEKLHQDSKSIASFPNKFVFICHKNQVEEVCKSIRDDIVLQWKDVAGIVGNYIKKTAGIGESATFDQIWDNSIENYWKLSWASSNFATINDKDELERLLPENKWKRELDTMTKFNGQQQTGKITNYDVSNLYGTTHSLVQGVLAAGKNKPDFSIVKRAQEGEKCPLCGEHQVLHNFTYDGTTSAKKYNETVTAFWDVIRKKANDNNGFKQVGEKERLCAVCTLKRFLPIALKGQKERNALLHETLAKTYDNNNFPSTTEMSAWEFLQTQPADKRASLIDKLHNQELEGDEFVLEGAKGFETKYYAFLLMDGDKMGDLINGETTEATWNDVLNIESMEATLFAEDSFKDKERTINPALHAMISDSLNNFARYGVQPAVQKSGGRLIYAGGDDVCAILPLTTAIETADKIRQAYQLSFAQVTENGSCALLENEQIGTKGGVAPAADMAKIVMHLGHSGEQGKTKISLSGAIIIAHHKTPLKEVISQAHKVLDEVAKEKSGRNSLAIRLDKRSGGARDMWFKWEERNRFFEQSMTCRESFEEIIRIAARKELSSSLLYKIEELRASIEPLAKNMDDNRELIVKLFEYEVAHSGYKTEAPVMARHLAGLCVKQPMDADTGKEWFNPEAAIIANFLARSGMKTGDQQKGEEKND